ncbi:NAD(P)-dependent dehydrogenase, short-chain alcohol dehydrogenase family [Aliiroseovarius sediminilitoris]|uniref:NAD(P)-dependent dehydrogenase, short-chain alcohol dehydrogenase family n=1 Tax=Aliiroseovarius sediminilitoris TaxID=1173584 RepID=A0A1I0R610_9RHOB|nr:SDR family NAD(P)-dependent oxidoreductase [Aliiroseovarius sediminilitoris]SEW35818.1 NAD(P)-dependent dehydrogenase, short-chain alcohol dehydrogenase family [Aliiroseovarius sediminilitoris]
MTESKKRALVIGSSGGVGQALMSALQGRGFDVTGLSRTGQGLDITNEGNVSDVFGQLDGSFDQIVVASGILAARSGPEKSIGAVTGDELAALFAVNAIGPALILKHSKHLMPRDRRVIFAALSARVGSIGDNRLGGWYSYRASKAALNQLIKTASVELRRTHKHLICVALHPGTVATPFTRDYPQHTSVAPKEAADNLLNVMEGLTPEDNGSFFDWAGKQVPW